MAYILPIVGVSDAALDTGTNSGDVTLTAVGSSPSANAATLSGQALTMQPADGTRPGALTAGAQTIGGAKTFASAILSGVSSANAITLTSNQKIGLGATVLYNDGGETHHGQQFTNTAAVASTAFIQYNAASTPVTLRSDSTDAANLVGVVVNTANAYTTAGRKLLSVQNAGTEKASFDLSGKLQLVGYTDSSASPGSATANTPSGRAAIAAGAAAVTITSSCCNANSIVLVQLEDLDTTALALKVVPAAGSFVVTSAANATATCKFRWIIFS